MNAGFRAKAGSGAALVAALALLLPGIAGAEERKSGGTLALSADTHTGAANTAGASGGTLRLSGAAGQNGRKRLQGATLVLQGGFFKATQIPGGPGRPVGVAQSSVSISWSWAAAADADSYKVFLGSKPAEQIGAAPSVNFQRSGLTVNSSHSIIVAAVNAAGGGAVSQAAVSVFTHANPPTGTSVAAVWQTSATISWNANNNPSSTRFEVERTTQTGGVGFAVIASSVNETTFTDTDLLGCTTYYFRVRYFNGDNIATAYDSSVTVVTLPLVPEPPSNLSAQPLNGNRVKLSWAQSPSEGITEYRVYYDAGTGTIDYATMLTSAPATATMVTTGVLVSSPSLKFGLRALHRCGVEEDNTTVVASSLSSPTVSGVRGAIIVPRSGKRIAGNRVLVKGAVLQNPSGPSITADDVARFRFQYRSLPAGAWTDIVAAEAARPNPDTDFPYFTLWDVTGLGAGDYELRAVARDKSGNDDPGPASVTVTVDAANPDTSESLVGGRVRKTARVANGAASTVETGDNNSVQTTEVVLPAGSLNASETQLVVTNNPAGSPAENSDLLPAVGTVEITLASGQSDLSGGNSATVTVGYPDADQNGVVDGTSVLEIDLRGYFYDTSANAWVALPSSVDQDANRLTITTTHFTFFGLFAAAASSNLSAVRVYPIPFMPNNASADDGVPFNASDPNSGIIFDNLTQNATIEIFNVTGQRIDRFDGAGVAGKLQWDVKNSAGGPVASGTYFAVIKSPGEKPVVKRIFIIR